MYLFSTLAGPQNAPLWIFGFTYSHITYAKKWEILTLPPSLYASVLEWSHPPSLPVHAYGIHDSGKNWMTYHILERKHVISVKNSHSIHYLNADIFPWTFHEFENCEMAKWPSAYTYVYAWSLNPPSLPIQNHTLSTEPSLPPHLFLALLVSHLIMKPSFGVGGGLWQEDSHWTFRFPGRKIKKGSLYSCGY